MRSLRNAIVHHKGLATEECTKLRRLPIMRIEDEICLSNDDLFYLTRAIRAYVDNIIRSATGVDPVYRTIWHVQ